MIGSRREAGRQRRCENRARANAMNFSQLHLCENPMGLTEKAIVDEQFDIMAGAEEFGSASERGDSAVRPTFGAVPSTAGQGPRPIGGDS